MTAPSALSPAGLDALPPDPAPAAPFGVVWLLPALGKPVPLSIVAGCSAPEMLARGDGSRVVVLPLADPELAPATRAV